MEHLTNTQPAASFTFTHLKCAKGVFRRVFWLHILMCVLLLAVGETNGQSSLPKAQNDSLWAVWNDAKQADTNRYKAIHTIIWKGYMNTDPDSALRIVELMLSDAEQKDRKSDRAQALNTRGAAYLMLGQNKNAEKSLISGLEQYVAIGDRKGIKEVYGNLANTYAQMGDFKKTLEYDSLTMVMAKKIGDARGIGKSMTNLGTTYYRLGRAEDAYRLIEEASEYLERGGYQPELASCLNNLGTLYRDQGDMSKAQITYQKSLGIMEKTDNPSGMAEVLLNLGNLNRLRGNYPLALEQTLKALKLAEAMPNETIMLVAYNNMGGIHSDEGNDSLSIAYHQHCLSLAESSGNTYYQAMSLSNIGKYFIKQQKYTEARPKMTRALQLRRAMGDAEGMAHSMQSLGELYKQNSETDIALSMYDSSAVIFRQFGMGSYVASSLNGKAAIYLEIGQVQKTIELGQEGLLLAKEASDPLETGNLANTLFKAFKLQNRHKEALEMHELFIQMRDSVWNEKNTRSIMSQQFQYNYEKKETILKAEQKSKDAIATSRIRNQRIAMMGMAGGGLLLLGLGISGFLLFRQRKRNETLAHSIAARDAERNRLARELHDGVAGELFGLQMAAQSNKPIDMRSELARLRDEIRHISHDLAMPDIANTSLPEMADYLIGRHRHTGREVVLMVQPPDDAQWKLPADKALHIYRMLQEGLGNALRHTAPEDLIKVRLNRSQSEVKISIENPNSKAEERTNGNGNGIGLKNLHERAELIGGRIEMTMMDNRIQLRMIIPINV